MSTKAKLHETLTDFNVALSQLEGIARDERSRVEGAFHGPLTAVGQLPDPVVPASESVAELANPVEVDQATSEASPEAPEPAAVEPSPEPTAAPQVPADATAEPQVAPEPQEAAVEPSQESSLDAPGD